MALLLFLLMLVVSTIFSMLGQGGGVLYTPLQVWAGLDFHVAATTSLFLIMCTSLSASLVFRRAKKIDWPLALVLETATAVGGFGGGVWSGQFSGDILSAVFAAVVAAAAALMIRKLDPGRAPAAPRAANRWTWQRALGENRYAVNLAVALPVSALAGLISGMVGVGGGILKVPMMVLMFRIPIDIAVGSSAMMVGLTAAAGFAGHVTNGHWDWRTSLTLAIAVLIGGQIGSRISIQLDQGKLKRRLGWFLLLVAAFMLARAWLT